VHNYNSAMNTNGVCGCSVAGFKFYRASVTLNGPLETGEMLEMTTTTV